MKKFGFWLKWIFFGGIINIFMWILAVTLYVPIIYPLRNFGVKYKHTFFGFIIWLFLDDENGFYGSDMWRGDKKKNLWTSFVWSAWRNPMWNVYQFIKPKVGPVTSLEEKGKLYKNGIQIPNTNFAVLKFVDEDGNWTDNNGKYMSIKFSIIGSSSIWYLVKNTLYYHKSFTRKVKNKFWYWIYGLTYTIFQFFKTFKVHKAFEDGEELWTEFHIGTNDKRYLFRFKFRRIKIYEYNQV